MSAEFPSSSAPSAVFAVSHSNSLYRFTPPAGWSLVGNFIGTINAGSGSSGQAEVYALTTTNEFAKFIDAGGWHVIGAAGTIDQFSATTGDAVFVITTDGSVAGFSERTGWFTLSPAGFALE